MQSGGLLGPSKGWHSIFSRLALGCMPEQSSTLACESRSVLVCDSNEHCNWLCVASTFQSSVTVAPATQPATVVEQGLNIQKLCLLYLCNNTCGTACDRLVNFCKVKVNRMSISQSQKANSAWY